MKMINFKAGNRIIPVGTPVTKVKKVYVSVRTGKEKAMLGGTGSSGDYYKKVRFHVKGQRRRIRIGFEGRYHPGKKIDDYMKFMFTEKTFEEQTVGMSEKEILAIKNAVLVEGMSKKAVLMSYGYPPEHKTPSLDHNEWTYWMNKRETKRICFDQNGRTIRCDKVKKTIKIEDQL